MITIGFLELNSISKGILAADEMIKAADITLIAARPSCPGKYQILITGEVSSVEAALDAGQAASAANVIDRLILPRIHPQIVEAINLSSAPERLRALGVMEFFSVTAAIMAADAAAKAADITLLEIRLGTGIGKSFVTMTGDVSAVTASVDAGMKSAEDSGMILDSVVIAHPDPELYRHLL